MSSVNAVLDTTGPQQRIELYSCISSDWPFLTFSRITRKAASARRAFDAPGYMLAIVISDALTVAVVETLHSSDVFCSI